METIGLLGGGAFVLVLAVFLIVMGLLSILMPLFIYHIRKSAQQTVQELQTLNTNLVRLLAAPQSPITPQGSARVGRAPDARPRPDATLEEKAKFYGVSPKT
jgi:hypothetical protein